jgi:hypothetical protein
LHYFLVSSVPFELSTAAGYSSDGYISCKEPQTPVSGAMERVSAMIPPPALTEPGSSNTEDEEDWD